MYCFKRIQCQKESYTYGVPYTEAQTASVLDLNTALLHLPLCGVKLDTQFRLLLQSPATKLHYLLYTCVSAYLYCFFNETCNPNFTQRSMGNCLLKQGLP